MAASGGRAAVFLDKDGTLIDDVPFNVDPARVTLLPGVAVGLRMLHEAGFALVVVSNQPGVALGHFDYNALRAVEARLDALAAAAGVQFSAYAWCPHHPAGVRAGHADACRCRKPAPGMLLEAAARHALDLRRSWMVGDILDDVEAGHRAGCRSVLVDRGGETQWRMGPGRMPDVTVTRFDEAAMHIVAAGDAQQWRDAATWPGGHGASRGIAS